MTQIRNSAYLLDLAARCAYSAKMKNPNDRHGKMREATQARDLLVEAMAAMDREADTVQIRNGVD